MEDWRRELTEKEQKERQKDNEKGQWLGLIILGILVAAVLIIIYVPGTIATVDTKAIKEAINPNRNYLIVVNEAHPYEFGGEYDQALQNDLVYPPDVYGEATPLEKATYIAFTKLQQDLADQGMTIGLYSGYRTEADQQEVYDYYSNQEGFDNEVAKPGYSEHHTGLIASIVIWHQGPEDEKPIWYTETAERQASIPEFRLLHETLADYGFIDRYPLEKEDITGVPCEPYEIRFVGTSINAHAIMDNNMVLEEFVGQLGPITDE